MPADDLAAELARESRDSTRPADAKRLAAALRALRPHAPDAPLELREALREAEESSQRPARETSKRLADATERLTARLEDRLSPRARAEMLARAERVDAEAESKPTARDDQDNVPLRQHAMIAETVRLPESVEALDQVDRAAELMQDPLPFYRALRDREPIKYYPEFDAFFLSRFVALPEAS